MTKYRAKPKVIDGIRFDSRAEAKRYSQLKLLECNGYIENLQVHPSFLLQDSFRYGETTYRSIKYEADFSYCENGSWVIEDVKGVETPVFRLKMKLFLYQNPDVDFRILLSKEI